MGGNRRFSESFLLIAIILLASGQTPIAAQSSAINLDRAKDLYGDALPEKAIARYGTTRLRFNQLGRGVSFSKDSKHVYSTDWDGTISVWSLEDGALLNRIDVGKDVDASVFVSDPTKLLVNRFNGVTILELPSGKTLHHIPSKQNNYRDMKLSPDGFLLASLPQAGVFQLWDTQSGAELLTLQTLDQRQQGFEAFTISPDSQQVAFALRSGRIEVWDLAKGATAHELTSQGGRVRWQSLHFLDDKRLLAGGATSKRDENGRNWQVAHLESWDLGDPTSSRLWTAGNRDLLGQPYIHVSPDRSRFSTSHVDEILVWDTTLERPIQTIKAGHDHGYHFALSPDNKLVSAAGHESKVLLWDIETAKEMLPQPDSHHGSVLDLVELSDAHLVSAGEEGTTRVWDRNSAGHVRLIHRNGGWTRSIAAFPDGKHVIVGTEYYDRQAIGSGFKGRVAIVRAADGTLIREWLQPDRVTQVAIDSTGQSIAFSTGIRDFGFGVEAVQAAKVQIWKLPSAETAMEAELSFELNDAPREISELRFIDNGLLLTCETGIFQWEFASDQVQPLKQPDERVFYRSLLAATDLSSVFECSVEHSRQDRVSTCKLARIDMQSDKVIWEQKFVDDSALHMQLSSTGDLLVAALRKKGQLVFLDVDSGQLIASVNLGSATVRTLRFSDDDRWLYAGMNQGDIVRWDMMMVMSR